MPAQLPIITKHFVQYSRTNFPIKSRHATKESYFNWELVWGNGKKNEVTVDAFTELYLPLLVVYVIYM